MNEKKFETMDNQELAVELAKLPEQKRELVFAYIQGMQVIPQPEDEMRQAG